MPMDVKEFETFLFDCDGVIWRDKHLIEGAKETISFLRAMGKKVYFITNNSTLSRAVNAKLFQERGITVTESEILSSAFGAAAYLKQRGYVGKNVFVIGERGIHDELNLQGIHPLGMKEACHCTGTVTHHMIQELEEENVVAVVVGYDRHFSYKVLAMAYHYLQNPDVEFVATNTDATFPTTEGFLPGSGCIVASVEKCAGRPPKIIGKPELLFKEMLEKECPDIVPERTLMVGDRLTTDIAFGNKAGYRTLFVLSGVHNMEDLKNAQPINQPHFYAPSIAALMNGGIQPYRIN